MKLKVERVYWHDNANEGERYKIMFIYPDSINTIEESMRGSEYTEILYSWGEHITVREPIMEFKERVDNLIIELENEERRREQNRNLGLD